MSEQQLWLFSQPKPLRDRFGALFFKGVPKAPGVYVMRDARDRVLYVGQSKNLRHRLCTYKNVRAEKDPRKIVRLVQSVDQITWEVCDSPERARLRENELLRLYRPKFNQVNTRPEAYGFIGFRATSHTLELWLTQDMSSPQELYGAFKGLRWNGYSALLRLLLRVLTGCQSAEQFPPRLLGRTPPRRFEFGLAPAHGRLAPSVLVAAMKNYLQGDSPELVDRCEECLPLPETLPPFWRNLQALDLQSARDFFERGPNRNRQLCQRHAIGSQVIAPATLDDLLVMTSPEAAAQDPA